MNESGSAWGGTARLVENLSIGVELGDDAYMFGRIEGIGIAEDRVFVLDGQVPIIRVYDIEGRHLADYGGQGEGPGEFREPDSLFVLPGGAVFVRDPRLARINKYASDGTPAGTYKMRGGFFTGRGTPMTVTPDGVPYSSNIVERTLDNTEWIFGMEAHGKDGVYGDPLLPPRPVYEPQVVVSLSDDGEMSTLNVPFTGRYTWAMAPNGAMIGGFSGSYEFDIRSPSGAVLRVVKHSDAVPVDAEEAVWHKRFTTALLRRQNPGWRWNGAEIPTVKHAYSEFLPGQSGELWVLRPGPGERQPDCVEDLNPENLFEGRCWRDATIIDAFDAKGMFLGEVEVPAGFGISPQPLIRGGEVWARFQDESGTPMVKRYRLVLPGEAQ